MLAGNGRSRWGYPQRTTPLTKELSESVTVTHPHHPLYGQRVAIVRIRQGLDPDLIVRLADGYHAAIAMSWTDYAGESALPTSTPDLPLLDGDGLRRAADFIARLRQEGTPPVTQHRTR